MSLNSGIQTQMMADCADGPFVLRGCIGGWPASRWTPAALVDLFGLRKLSARFGPRQHSCGHVLFEPQSPRVDASFGEFMEWTLSERCFDELRADTHWGYVDYKYMFETMPSEHLKDVDWTAFGVEADGTDSSVWIGTAGAYTPCHYDTYGFNLHAQLFGRKRWLLFPPGDDLKATRIPYEDSSVFSRLDILSCPDELSSAHPHMVILEPGDVLYVPPYWWHFVQCLDLSISVNTWVPVPHLDSKMHEQEACTRLLFGMLHKNGLLKNQMALCPSETDDVDCEEALDLLNSVRADAKKPLEDHIGESAPPAKKQRTCEDSHSAFLSRHMNSSHRLPVNTVDIASLKVEFETGPLQLIRPSSSETDIASSSDDVTERRFLDSLLHPHVMSALATILNRN